MTETIEPRCPKCHHRMGGVGGCCSVEWCRCSCVDEVEIAKNANTNADRPPLETKL